MKLDYLLERIPAFRKRRLLRNTAQFGLRWRQAAVVLVVDGWKHLRESIGEIELLELIQQLLICKIESRVACRL